MNWVDVDDRMPDLGRYVKVWGTYCVDGFPAPVACRRVHASSVGWFWSSTEFRGSSGIFWWWDGPAVIPPERHPTFRAILPAAIEEAISKVLGDDC